MKRTTRFAQLEAICRLAGAGAMSAAMKNGEPGPCPKCFGAPHIKSFGAVEVDMKKAFPKAWTPPPWCAVCGGSGFVEKRRFSDPLVYKHNLVPGVLEHG